MPSCRTNDLVVARERRCVARGPRPRGRDPERVSPVGDGAQRRDGRPTDTAVLYCLRLTVVVRERDRVEEAVVVVADVRVVHEARGAGSRSRSSLPSLATPVNFERDPPSAPAQWRPQWDQGELCSWRRRARLPMQFLRHSPLAASAAGTRARARTRAPICAAWATRRVIGRISFLSGSPVEGCDSKSVGIRGHVDKTSPTSRTWPPRPILVGQEMDRRGRNDR